MSHDGFDKDKVEIDKEIQRLNEEFGKYNKAYDCGLNLIKKKTVDSPSHRGSHRRGSREFSIGSNEKIRSNMSGELSVYSQNSNESGNSSDRSTSSPSRRLLKGVASTAKKTHLFAKGIPAKQIKRNLGFCEEMIKPLFKKINEEINEIEKFFEDIRKALYDFEKIYQEDFDKYNQIFSKGEADNSGALQNALNLLREKETIIYLIDLFRMKQTNPNFPQQVVGSEDEHFNEPSLSTNDEHFGDLQNYPQLHSGQNTEWSNQLNQPGNPSSSQGPWNWNQPFDSNQYHPSYGHWPNPLGYGYHNQHNTSIQQNPSGQQIVWDWMNNASSSTHYEPYGGPHNPHLVQSVQGQNTMLGYPLHHPWYPPFHDPHGLHQIQSDQSQNTISGDHLNDPVNPPPSFQNPVDQHNPRDWNRFH
uniref:Uncharacterized protein n=1 Tax=Meloidogyne javanica TaxID=6303 RepID=A0A915N7H4_MELJA